MLSENYQSSSMNPVLTGFKINMQKSLAFLYTNNEISEREIKETIPFTISQKKKKKKKKKNLGRNLPKEEKALYCENYKTLLKETENDTKRWKDIYHVLGLEESILSK